MVVGCVLQDFRPLYAAFALIGCILTSPMDTYVMLRLWSKTRAENWF